MRRCTKGRGLTYAEFEFGFVIAAFGIALTAGFGFAAVLSVLMGFGLPLGGWWMPMLQAHGHAQLMGWTGLFIVGVSLFFVPRLAGVPLRFPGLLPWICALLTAGILLRAGAQPLLSASISAPLRSGLRLGLGVSAIAEAIGVGLYLFLLLAAVLRAAPHRRSLHSVRIYLLMAVFGWIGYTGIGGALALFAAYNGTALLQATYNRFAIDLFIYLVLLPVAMAFSVRTFPLYLRLPAADWPVHGLGLAYLSSLALEKLPVLFEFLGAFSEYGRAARIVSPLAQILKAGVLLLFVWGLDLLRKRLPWTVNRVQQPAPDRRPTRQGLPDYGEFGRFEWLLYAAYAWLALGAGLEIAAGLAALAGRPLPVDPDTVRHTYLAGFISLLLFGMAPRMIPGFLHRRQVAYPRLVAATFWVASVSALFRVGPLLLSEIVARIPGAHAVSTAAFGISGLLGWAATALLGYNLWATWGKGNIRDKTACPPSD